jgi:threonine/homoserine/homoserine lactone efflux protein
MGVNKGSIPHMVLLVLYEYSQTTLLSIQDSKKNRNNSSTDLYWFYNDLTIHISYSVLGLSFLKHYIPDLLHIIQYIGALYLMYIGYKTFTQQQISDHATHTLLHPRQAFIQGFLGNSLNPKTTLFVMSIFAQLLRGNHGLIHLIGYGMFISASHLLWFLLISLFCSTPVIRNKILRKQVSINRVIGTVLATLGLCLFLTN